MADEQKPMTFTQILGVLNDGQTLPELDERLKELTAAVLSTGKGGALTLTVRVTPANAKANCDVLNITDEIALKQPRHERSKEMFFADQDCNLARNPFRQKDIPFPALVGKDAQAATA